jgi:serine/threonine-protein phosphatase 2A regulatory subunit B
MLQVITCADFHPNHCNIFAYSSSKGCIRLVDMRGSALCDRHTKAYEEPQEAQVRGAAPAGQGGRAYGVCVGW